MEFDARVKEPDKVGFEAKLTMPDGATVELAFRDFAKIPGRISIDNPGDSEGQLWGSLAWGLIEPKNWPTGSDSSAANLFRELPMDITLQIHRAWQKNAGVTLGESDASTTSSKSTAKS